MGEPGTVMNIGDLAKPVETLLLMVRDAFGGAVRPWQITRVARAEAERIKILSEAEAQAEITRAAVGFEITARQRRAMERHFVEESMHQENMEEITRKALPGVQESARPEEIERDWLVHFYDRCRLTSDEEMQTLWARVLSGQANAPGSYSKRTVEILAVMEKQDAELFRQLCGFSVSLGPPYPLIYDDTDAVYVDHGIHFDSLSHLESLGLIQYDNIKVFYVGLREHEGNIMYFGVPVWMSLGKQDGSRFEIGRVKLTRAGVELANACEPGPVNGFVDYLREKWKELGYRVEREERGEGEGE